MAGLVLGRYCWLMLAAVLLVAAQGAGCATRVVTSAQVVSSVERERYATEARWAPGQLEAHFQKHPEGYSSIQDYDRGARETIRIGVAFTYRDRETGERRLGFYDRSSNRFTGLSGDGRRITTHFRPDRGEQYIRSLPESTYP